MILSQFLTGNASMKGECDDKALGICLVTTGEDATEYIQRLPASWDQACWILRNVVFNSTPAFGTG